MSAATESSAPSSASMVFRATIGSVASAPENSGVAENVPNVTASGGVDSSG